MKPNKIKRPLLIFLIAALSLLSVLVIWDRKTITLIIDGKSNTRVTYLFTIAQFMRSVQVPVAAQDSLQPGMDHWLKNGETIVLNHASQVLVLADGAIYPVTTASSVPGDWLAQVNVALNPYDQVIINGQVVSPTLRLAAAPLYSVYVLRAVPVLFLKGDQKIDFHSTQASLGQALWDKGISIKESDVISPSLETALTDLAPLEPSAQTNMIQAGLSKSVPITITADGKTIHTRSAAGSVGEALADGGVSLQGLDYSRPPAESPVPEDGFIQVVRVQESVIVEEAPIPFETKSQELPEVELDNQQIIQTGEYGISARRVRVRYENGQEVSRQVEDEWQARPPKARITGYGTKIVMHTLDTPDGQIQYWRVLTMWITSYHPSDGAGDITANGQRVRKGLVGVNPRYIPYGTKMYVPGYGAAEAADTGAIGPRWVDLGYSDADYKEWHQYEKVYFLWPPPANILWVYPP